MSQTPDPSDKLDARADGNFGSSGAHRGGYGSVVLNGVTYSKLAWIERTARMGGTLAAAEGLVLCHELDRLRTLLKDANDVLVQEVATAMRAEGNVERMRPVMDAVTALALSDEGTEAAARGNTAVQAVLTAYEQYVCADQGVPA